jgi:hypothetical protein
VVLSIIQYICNPSICAKKSPEDGQEKTETCSDEKYIEINILITK